MASHQKSRKEEKKTTEDEIKMFEGVEVVVEAPKFIDGLPYDDALNEIKRRHETEVDDLQHKLLKTENELHNTKCRNVVLEQTVSELVSKVEALANHNKVLIKELRTSFQKRKRKKKTKQDTDGDENKAMDAPATVPDVVVPAPSSLSDNKATAEGHETSLLKELTSVVDDSRHLRTCVPDDVYDRIESKEEMLRDELAAWSNRLDNMMVLSQSQSVGTTLESPQPTELVHNTSYTATTASVDEKSSNDGSVCLSATPTKGVGKEDDSENGNVFEWKLTISSGSNSGMEGGESRDDISHQDSFRDTNTTTSATIKTSRGETAHQDAELLKEERQLPQTKMPKRSKKLIRIHDLNDTHKKETKVKSEEATQKKYEQMKEALASLVSTLNEMTASNQASSTRVAKLEADLKENEKELEQLNLQLTSYDVKEQVSRGSLSMVTTKLSESEARNTILKQLIKDLRERLRQEQHLQPHQSQFYPSPTSGLVKDEEIQRLKKELNRFKNENKSKSDDENEFAVRLDAVLLLEAVNLKKEKEVQHLRAVNETHVDQVQQLKASNTELHMTLDAKDKETEQIKVEIEAEKKTLEKEVQRLSEQEESFAMQLESLTTLSRDLEAEKKMLESQVEKLKAQAELDKQQLDKLTISSRELEAEKSTMAETEIEHLKAQVESNTIQLETLAVSCCELEAEKKRTDQEVEQLKGQVESSKIHRQVQHGMMSITSTKLAESEAWNTILKGDLDAARNENHEMAVRINEILLAKKTTIQENTALKRRSEADAFPNKKENDQIEVMQKITNDLRLARRHNMQVVARNRDLQQEIDQLVVANQTVLRQNEKFAKDLEECKQTLDASLNKDDLEQMTQMAKDFARTEKLIEDYEKALKDAKDELKNSQRISNETFKRLETDLHDAHLQNKDLKDAKDELKNRQRISDGTLAKLESELHDAYLRNKDLEKHIDEQYKEYRLALDAAEEKVEKLKQDTEMKEFSHHYARTLNDEVMKRNEELEIALETAKEKFQLEEADRQQREDVKKKEESDQASREMVSMLQAELKEYKKALEDEMFSNRVIKKSIVALNEANDKLLAEKQNLIQELEVSRMFTPE